MIPRIRWACDAVVIGCDDTDCANFEILEMWGENHMVDHLKLKIGDRYGVALGAFARQSYDYNPPNIGDRVLITTEHYVTHLGHDQYRYMGKKI